MNISTFAPLLLIGATVAVGATGCKRDPALGELNRLKETAIKMGCDVEEQRAELALSKWQNGRLDSEPIMLWAELVQTTGRETKNLTFFTFDEDKDIVGFGIVEKYIDANGLSTSLAEEYETTGTGPYPPDEAVQFFGFIVQIRDAGQRKDEQRWNEYLKAKLRDVNAREDRISGGRPPIWISIPEPNRADVHIYIYDQEGYKSETIRVRNTIPQENQGQLMVN